MARGWESKGVADQIEEGNQPIPARSDSPTRPEDRQRKARLEALRLSRSRSLDQLEKATHPAYREMLLKGLAAIEKQIEEVTSMPTE